MQLFLEIGILIVLGTLGGMLAKYLKQPLIPAYILIGIILGPALGILIYSEVIENLSLIGIAFLLFIVGLEFKIDNMRYIGKIATVGAVTQMLLIFVFGFIIAMLLGFWSFETVYIGLIVMFSSTLVVVKILSDRKELMTLHGKIIIGILLMQDIVAIVALTILYNVDSLNPIVMIMGIIEAAMIVGAAFLLNKYIFPRLFKFAAKSQELLFLIAISVCFLFSLAFSIIGFSIAIGAFVAGVSLANLPYNLDIIAKVRSLRDFFATIFFVSLGLEMTFGGVKELVIPLIALSVFVIFLKPFIILVITSFFGYTKKTTFLTALGLAQISEFSLILVYQGRSLGHISSDLVTLTILLAIVTISSTSYFEKYSDRIYKMLSKNLGVFEISSKRHRLEYIPENIEYDVLLVGCDRIGYNVFKSLSDMNKSFLVIDYNPDIIKELVRKKIHCIYGDIGDPDILDRLNLKKLSMIVSTVPDIEDNRQLITRTRFVNHKAIIFVTASNSKEAIELYNVGADYVILPHFLGGERVSTLLQSNSDDLKKIIKNKYEHIDELRKIIAANGGHS